MYRVFKDIEEYNAYTDNGQKLTSRYDVWMGTGDFYLGKYGWTKVEQ